MSVYDSILITGGGGMLGHALTEALLDCGHRPVSFNRSELDITSEPALRATFAEHMPTLVLNCAGHTKVDLCEEQKDLCDAINGHGVGTLAALSRDSGAKLVHVSTDFVFNGQSKRPYLPEDPVDPLSVYGRSKLLGEKKLQEISPPGWLIVRTAWVYGRHGANFPRTMINAARAGKSLKVVNDQIGSPTYTPDLAEAILALVDASTTGIYHVTNAGQTNWFEFTRAILEEFHLQAELTPTTAAEWFKIRPNSAIRPAYSVLDLEAFSRATGKSMRPWRDALRDYRQEVESLGF